MAETKKSYARRVRENWFDTYAPYWLSGIDLGCSTDPLNSTFRRFDMQFGDGDAQKMEGFGENLFHTIYASHLLEHVHDPVEALKNWYKICRAPGHIIICVPHRDLYEKKKNLPSRWNGDHKTFWLPETGEPPVTRGLRETILQAIPNANIALLRVLDEGWVSNGEKKHSGGEYSIEAIIRKEF
jgi:SAM-dependent methyltransferase